MILGLYDIVFLVGVYVSLYVMTLFTLLFFKNKDMQSTPISAFLPKVTFLIPAYNEEKNIEKTVEAVKNTKYRGEKEIIVIDDGSTDNTAKIAKKCGVKVIIKKNTGKASSLNVGVKASTGDIVACVDADSSPLPDALENAVPYFDDPDVAAVTSTILVKEPKGILQRLQHFEYVTISWARKLLEMLESIYVTPGPLALYRKDVLNKVGGFDEKCITEDIEITWRLQKAGYKIRMAFASRVYTSTPNTLRAWWRQRVRWNIGGFQTLNKYKTSFGQKGMFGRFIIPFFLIWLVIGLASFIAGAYVFGQWMASNFLFIQRSLEMGINPFTHFEILLTPLFLIFGTMVLVFSIFYIKINFKPLKTLMSGKKEIVNLLIYLTVYLPLFPILLVHSLMVYFKKDKSW